MTNKHPNAQVQAERHKVYVDLTVAWPMKSSRAPLLADKSKRRAWGGRRSSVKTRVLLPVKCGPLRSSAQFFQLTVTGCAWPRT